MNQNRDEQKLKTLFHDLRAEDELHAPSFSNEWEAAIARRRLPRRPLRPAARWAIVAAAAMVILCSTIYFFSRNSPKTVPANSPGSIANATPVPDIKPSVQGVPTGPDLTPVPGRTSQSPGSASLPSSHQRSEAAGSTPRRSAIVIRHRPDSDAQAAAILISQWRSPTDFLLAFPADRLLKSVPRLNDSVVEITPAKPEM